MRNPRLIAALAGVMLVAGVAASASTFAVDVQWVNELLEEGDTVEYQHDVIAPLFGDGIDPGNTVIHSADLFIKFKDDVTYRFKWVEESVSIYEDGVYVETRVLPDEASDIPRFYIKHERFDVDLYSLEDGYLDIALHADQGDFYVVASKLIVEHTPIPEPAMLIGLGAIGLGMARVRRKWKRIE